MQWITDLCKDTTKTFVFHNALYDLGWLRAEGVEVKGQDQRHHGSSSFVK